MPLRHRLAKILPFALVGAACGLVDSGPYFRYAAATNDCGPADGPAVSIYLASWRFQELKPPAPYIRLIVWQPRERLAGRSWSLAAGEAVALRVQSQETDERATSGSVVVDALDDHGGIHGSAELWFSGGSHLTLSYDAAWILSPMLCG
jgi:hypothetical protein